MSPSRPTPARPSALLAILLGTLGLSSPGCHRKQTPPAEAAASLPTAPACLLPERPMARVRPGPDGRFPSAACVEQAQQIVSKLSPEAKFGQMMQPDRGAVRSTEDVARFGYGSILSGGGSGPTENSPLAWAKMVNGFREQSLKAQPRLPVIYGIDAVHGHNNVRGAVIFPHNIGLGAAGDAELVERIGRATAEEVSGTNIDWTFSPVLAAARDERWGRTYEAFGETPELATSLGPALIRGLQGERLGHGPASVLACAKHFVGDGYTEGGKDRGNSPLSPEQVETQLLPSYQAAIEAGVGSMMVSFSSVDGIKMHCHGPLLNDVLKTELGFEGFLVSDWEAVELLPGDYPTQLASAINAGLDMVMAPKVGNDFVRVMKSLVPARISQERIDDAVTRIVTAKCELGMLDADRYARDRSGQLQIQNQLETIGSAEHRALAREAVARSLVLLKNTGGVLPLTAESRIHLSGSHSDDIGLQSGGWTITWQGSKGDITEGTTLREAFSARLGNNVTHLTDGPSSTAPNVNVLVTGERPYAESQGDDPKLELPEAVQLQAQQLKAQGVPLVIVLIVGRPLILGPLLDLADGLVVAWLPGTEGAGVTDVLFGDKDFQGKLPHTWPKDIGQVPINVGDEAYDPLFPYGFGLSYEVSPAEPQPPTGGTSPRL